MENTEELNKFDPVLQTAMDALDQAKQEVVVDSETAMVVKTTGLELKKIENATENIRKELVKPYNDQVKKINTYAKEILAPVIQAKDILKQKIFAWQKIENERIQEENRKLAEERERLQKIENNRIAFEEDLRKKAAEKLAAEFGKKEEKIAPVQRQEIETPAPIQESKAIQTRTVWKYKIVSPALIPREFLSVNEVGVRKAVVSDGVREITGIHIYSVEEPVMR